MSKHRRNFGNPVNYQNGRQTPYNSMNNQSSQDFNKLGDFLVEENDLGIVIGAHQNLDTVASALALYLSLQQAGKNVQIVSIKEPLVEISSLVGVDKIKNSFSGDTSKLVVALPYIKGEVEKVLFTEQQDTINFHLTAAPGRTISPFDLNQVKLIWEGSSPKNIITVGVGSENELEGIVSLADAKIVNIDNYPNNSGFGDIVLVDSTFSSLAEIVGKIIKDQRLPMDQDIAQNILDGVLFATRNFTKGNTSPAAFETASYAMYQGAQRKGEGTVTAPQRQPQMPVQDNRQFGNPSNQAPYEQPSFGNSQPRQNRQAPRPYDVAARQTNRQIDPGQARPQGQRRDNRNSFNQPQDTQNRAPKVNQNDFPAMHIQDIRSQIQNDARMQNPKPNNNQRNFHSQNRNVNPMPEEVYEDQPQVQDEQVINEQPQMSSFDAPQVRQDKAIQNQPMPQEEEFDNNSRSEDVPDDWLMPKVFKSSKNNN